MNSTVHLLLLILTLAIDTLFCLLVAVAAGVLARLDGVGHAAAVGRAGVAFAGSVAVSLALLTFIAAAL